MNMDVVIQRISDSVTKNTYTDLGLVLSPYTLEPPDPQTTYVTIAGRDGDLDLSEALGQLNYKNRILTLTFTELGTISDIYTSYSTVANFLHGQRVKVTFPNDTDYYLKGRAELGNLDRAKRTGNIVVKVNCEPWRYKQSATVNTFTIGALPYTKVITNLRMPTTPTIVTTSDVVMNYDSVDYSWAAGTHTNAAIILKEGNNTFTFKTGSSGDVTFTYQEGTL